MQSSEQREVFAVAILFTILTCIAVGLRVWVRAGMLHSFGCDDWAMLATQFFFIVYLVCQFGGVYHGTGVHLSELEPQAAETALAFWFFCELFYTISTVILKVAIGLFLLRVATHHVHIWIIRVVMAASVCLEWTYMGGFAYTISVMNVFADWVFGILPALIVKGLSITRRQKTLIACILAFAAVGSTATIVRLPFIRTLEQGHLGRDGDFLYNTVGLAIWTTVEVGVGITASCMATLRPLLRSAFMKLGVKGTIHEMPAPSNLAFKNVTSPPLDGAKPVAVKSGGAQPQGTSSGRLLLNIMEMKIGAVPHVEEWMDDCVSMQWFNFQFES
ncbi:hypothetical protein KC323_g8703 [Hortaea werneckii]|nr:hypothetical protein KC323_g8703 [Hortaea werneckii]